jgi:hypothetical protein
MYTSPPAPRGDDDIVAHARRALIGVPEELFRSSSSGILDVVRRHALGVGVLLMIIAVVCAACALL